MIRLSTTSRESYDDGQRATSADGDLDFERRRVVRSTLYAYLRYVRELSTNFTNSLSTVRTGGAINVSANCRFAFSFVRPPRSSRFLPRIIAGERLLLQVYVCTVLRASPPPRPPPLRSSSSRGNFLLPPFPPLVVFPVTPVRPSKAMCAVSEVAVAVGDVSNTRHSNIPCMDDFGIAPLQRRKEAISRRKRFMT